MKIIFTAHVEGDYGMKKKKFLHLDNFIKIIKDINIPITLALGVGGNVDDSLLRYFTRYYVPDGVELALHYHFKEGENILESRNNIDIYTEKFYDNFGFRPTSIVFGHWTIKPEILQYCSELGYNVDGSYTPYRSGESFVIKNPFRYHGLIEVPVVSNGYSPLNPFLKLSHYLIVDYLIRRYFKKDIVFHVGFHSYDRNLKRIFNFAHKYKKFFVTLSDVNHFFNTEYSCLKKEPFIDTVRRIKWKFMRL